LQVLSKSHQIAVRLGISFSALLVILIAVGWMGLHQMDLDNARLAELQGKDWTTLRLTEEAARYSNSNSRITMQLFLLDDEEQIKALEATRAENSKKISELLEQVEESCDSDEERKLLAAIQSSRQTYIESYMRALHLLLNEKNAAEAKRIMALETTPAMFKYHAAYNDLVQLEEDHIDQAADSRRLQQAITHRFVMWAIVLSVLLTGIIAFITARRIIRETTEHLRNYEKMYVELRQSIAQRERADERVRLQSAALESAANAIIITDPRGTIQWVNRAFTQLTGYPLEEVLGQTTRVLKSGEQDESFYQDLWKTILAGKVWSGGITNRKKDGQLYLEEMTIAPVLSAKREITNFIAVKQDVTERKRVEAALQQSEEQFRDLAENIPEVFFVVQLDPVRTTYVSPAYDVIWGRSRQELYEDPAAWMEAVHQEDRERVKDSFAHSLQGNHLDTEYRVVRPDGSVRYIHAQAFPVLSKEGKLSRIVGLAQDVTQRVESEERLRLWLRVLEQSGEGIFICDAQEKIVLVNTAFEKLTGFSAEEALGKTPRILQSGRQDRAFYAELWKSVAETGTWSGEMWNRRKSGEIYVEWLSIGAVRDPKGPVTHYVGIFSDITIRKQAEDRLVRLAHFDALTDLPNRILLQDRLSELIKSAQRAQTKVGVIFIDLDRFKDVNDSLGHGAGDLLLQTLAKRLSGAVREQDTVARMGGDEFVVLIQGLRDVEDIPALAQKLLSCLIKPVTLNGYELTITASLGISLYPDDATTGPELVRNADAAMYKAKDAGRNAYRFYTSDLNQRALEMLSMENSLRRAIERKEFVLHYQPQVDIKSGSVVGAEALIRWNHPELGLVMPGKFIPIAEERGLIVPIGSWVIEEAARQAAIWRDSGTSMPIAVNVSAVQFRQKDFVEQLADTVQKHGIAPDRLELELTESIIMRDAETTIKVLEKLHDQGFQLSIDDFGTGYSSLNYLRRFPIDKIKIDQSFVRAARDDEGAAGIVTAIIALARSLKLKVIAEGVETGEQLEILRAQGCDEAQGYLFSRGLAPEEFQKLIREWKLRPPRTPEFLPV
jgi:diguanylate cyclase (GGDEF)-like protein/PAS domain S-box-containing protein